MSDDARFEKGLEMLDAIEDGAADEIAAVLQEMAPDYAKTSVAYAFGDIYSRTEQLDLKSREIATVAALTAMGTAQPQLKVHIRSALKVGITQAQLAEIIGHVGVYAGVPAAMNAFYAMKQAITEREAQQQR